MKEEFLNHRLYLINLIKYEYLRSYDRKQKIGYCQKCVDRTRNKKSSREIIKYINQIKYPTEL